MRKSVPLLKISSNSSIYFDFEKEKPYIQYFDGPYTEKARGDYSKSNTFWLGQIVSGIVAFLSFIINALFTLPVVLSIAVAIFVGYVAGWLVGKIMVANSLRERDYKKITKEEITKCISEAHRFWVLRITEIVFAIGVFLGILLALLYGEIRGKYFLMLMLGVFVIKLLNYSVHPRLMLKARKILKKQLKEGKFDD